MARWPPPAARGTASASFVDRERHVAADALGRTCARPDVPRPARGATMLAQARARAPRPARSSVRLARRARTGARPARRRRCACRRRGRSSTFTVWPGRRTRSARWTSSDDVDLLPSMARDQVSDLGVQCSPGSGCLRCRRSAGLVGRARRAGPRQPARPCRPAGRSADELSG